MKLSSKIFGAFSSIYWFYFGLKMLHLPNSICLYAKHCLILKGNIEISLVSLTSNKWYINHIDHITILKISLSLIVCDLFDWTTNIFDLINYWENCVLGQLGPKINIWSSNHPYLSPMIWDSNRQKYLLDSFLSLFYYLPLFFLI